MTEEIDINKLTNDAFMAIDALFTDEDDMFSEKEETKEPDDFEIIQEYMLAIEWECSERNIRKFVDFLNKLIPKYSDKHNQDILKMLMSIVKYLEKSKANALPETHQVMEFIVKTFKNINKNELNEDAVKSEKNAAYNKVLDLKGKIAKSKAEAVEKADALQEKVEQYNNTNISLVQTAAASTQTFNTQIVETIESSPIIANVFARLELSENRITAIDAQNSQIQQQLYELNNRYAQLNQQLSQKINELESKLAEKLNDLPNNTSALSSNKHSEDNIESISFESVSDDEMDRYDEINFDGIDFDNMSSDDAAEQKTKHNQSLSRDNLNEISLEEVSLEQLDIGGAGLPDDKSVSKEDNKFELNFDDINTADIKLEDSPDNNDLFEELAAGDIEYEELTADDLKYDDKDISSRNNDIKTSVLPDNIDENTQNEPYHESELLKSREEKQEMLLPEDEKLFKESKSDSKDKKSKNSNDAASSAGGYSGDIQTYVKCFKIDNQIIAFPDDRIYNIYKIPSKLSIKIKQAQTIVLGEFSSFFQNLSKNMKGHLKDIGNASLKKMNVDIELLTDKDVSYRTAVLCSIDDKISIIPVSDMYNNRNYLITNIKNEKNNFSDYNINIIDIGAIPFLPLHKI